MLDCFHTRAIVTALVLELALVAYAEGRFGRIGNERRLFYP
jgi:hypothetical protein